MRFEGVARTHAGGLPCAHVAVVFGRQAFEERQGAVAQTFAAGVASVGELQDGDEVDSDDVGLERPDALGTFVALGAGDVVPPRRSKKRICFFIVLSFNGSLSVSEDSEKSECRKFFSDLSALLRLRRGFLRSAVRRDIPRSGVRRSIRWPVAAARK